MIFIVLVSIIAIVTAQSHQQSRCSRLRSAYESMCPGQAIASLQGSEGERDAAGTRDPGEEVNYAELSGLVQEVTQNLTNRISFLSDALTAVEEKLRQVEIKSGFCHIRYEGKCYWFDIDLWTDFENAQERCSTHGGKPANIYSKIHYYTIFEHLRLFTAPYYWTTVWLGMKYDYDTTDVLLSDGSRAPFYKLKGDPIHNRRYTRMALGAMSERSDSNENMFNSLSDALLHGVICEEN